MSFWTSGLTDPQTRGVIAFHKHATTPDVTDGIEAAVKRVLTESSVDPAKGEILSLTIGTTVRPTFFSVVQRHERYIVL